MKTAIVYSSWHQGNTRRAVNAIAQQYPVDYFDTQEVREADLSGYDLIGFGSGVYVEKPSKKVLRFLQRCLPTGKRVFFLYTCGMPRDSYMDPLKRAAEEKEAEVLGVWGCPGCYDFKLIKRNQGRPNQEDLSGAVAFFREILKKTN